MKHLFLFTILLGLIIHPLHTTAQTPESFLTLKGEFWDVIYDMEKAPNGDVFVVGQATNMADFNPNGTPNTISVPAVPATDAFIARYTSDMTLSWLVTFTGRATKILLDDSLNVYVLGRGTGTIDFNPTVEVDTLNMDSNEYFVAKYGGDGSFKAVNYTEYTGNQEWDDAEQDLLFRDSFGYIYVFGYENQSIFYPTVSRYSSNLDLLWTEEIGLHPQLINNTEFYSVRRPNYTIPIPTGFEDEIVFYKHNTSSGNLTDSIIVGDIDSNVYISLLKGTPDNELLMYGYYWGKLSLYQGADTLVFENYNYDYWPDGSFSKQGHGVVCKFNNAGNLLWAKTITGNPMVLQILKTDQNGNIYGAGNFMEDSTNFSAGSTPVIESAAHHSSSYIVKYDSEFNYLGLYHLVGNHSEILDFDFYTDTLMICGSFFDSLDVDLSSSEQILEGDSTLHDAYLLTYSDFDITGFPISVEEITEYTPEYFNVFSSSATGKVYVNISEEVSGVEVNRVHVYDINGRLLTSTASSEKLIELDMISFPEALYIVRVENDVWSASRKIVVKSGNK